MSANGRRFPDWIKAFVDYASFGEAPLTMYFWVGVSTIAGALRRQVWIDMGYFEWVPNFYVILVAPPGIVAKSTTGNLGMSLLRQVKGIKFGPDVVTWQKLAEALAQAREMFELPNGDLVPMSAMTIEASEFGTFLNPNDRDMIDVLVALWDGKKGGFSKWTKTQGNDMIENPFINILACTTPAWIEGNFPEYLIGGGFTSRCIFVYAEQKRQYTAYPILKLPADLLQLKSHLIEDLERISMLRGEYRLSPEAYKWGEDWYKKHYTQNNVLSHNDRFAGYLARKQTHIHKLSMVLAASTSDELVIHPHTLEFADKLVSSLEADMPKVFDRIGLSPEMRGLAQLVNIVRAMGAVPSRELYQRLFHIMDWQTYQGLLNSAVNAGYVVQNQEGKELMVRRVS